MDREYNVSTAEARLPGSNIPAVVRVPPVRIYQPARSVMQSGPGRRDWVLEFEGSSRPVRDPLMGWTGSADPFSQIQLSFPDLQSAIEFADRHGWQYRVEEPHISRISPKAYTDHFKYELADAIRRATYREPRPLM
jgi:hypothetical protein